jgi:cell division protein ZapA
MAKKQPRGKHMGQLAVTIGGRVYRLACDEGEEARLADLAQLVDARIAALRQRFGELGDQRLIIMAAITFADEWSEANERLREREAEAAKVKAAQAAAAQGRDSWAGQVASSLDEAASRVEEVTHRLNESCHE